jgi:serine/threonine-protein kinase
MPPDSATTLADTLRQSRLLEPAQLAELAQALGDGHPDPHALARDLVRRGWLTPFQADQLLQGRGDELLLGSYVLLEKLGEGGMGTVFKARNWKLGKLVALKLIRKERLSRPEVVQRFRQRRAVNSRANPGRT